MLGLSDLGACSLDSAARAIGRTICADTLEPINLKLYERGRNRPLSVYAETHEAIRRMRHDVGEAVDAFDIILTASMATAARRHGGVYTLTNATTSVEEFMEADYREGSQLAVFNVTGQPSMSLPLAQSVSGLPIGLQIVGRFGKESTLLRVARDLEEARPLGARRPGILAGKHLTAT